MKTEKFDLKNYLSDIKTEVMLYGEFLDRAFVHPEEYFHTSSSILSSAIRNFGYKIVIRSGEPVVSYNIFSDPFSDGINAIYGQEFCIDKIMDIIDSSDSEVVPSRGIVLVGPPSSGKTNIIDMIIRALEEYSKETEVKLYTFLFEFNHNGKKVQIRSPFNHNPILLIPSSAYIHGKVIYPRKDLFNMIEEKNDGFKIQNYYQNATLDKFTLDVIDDLMAYTEKTYSEILDSFVRVEEINFSISQGKGISNIDNMANLETKFINKSYNGDFQEILGKFLPGKTIYRYNGPLVSCNRGVLHIHDAFRKDMPERDYRPLLMLLGSGKMSLESTQTSLDTTIFITTNLEEMKSLEEELTSVKLLDRIEKVPVNYLVDVNAEMEILERDMSPITSRYDIDPNLIRIASYYSVITRLMPPKRKGEEFPSYWSILKRKLYKEISPEQKMFIYSSQCIDPVKTIKNIPMLHPFRNEASKLDINIEDESTYVDKIDISDKAVNLESSGIFSNEDLHLIDDEFMRFLIGEHYPEEGKYGMSVRQLQNIMRDTIASSDGSKITVNQFIKQLKKVVSEGSAVHYWLNDAHILSSCEKDIESREIYGEFFEEAEGSYGDYESLVDVVVALYNGIIKNEVTIATVDRNPEEIENDLRRYMQYILLHSAHNNESFSDILIKKYAFIDPVRGTKIDKPDYRFMKSIEHIIMTYETLPEIDEDEEEREFSPEVATENFRKEIAEKFFKCTESGDLKINKGCTIINSRDSSFVHCFGREYTKLLSHRKEIEGIDIEKIEYAFFLKFNKGSAYDARQEG